ncbi:MAG: aldehyde dehydrogenase family protein [Planctomycetota bacterium]
MRPSPSDALPHWIAGRESRTGLTRSVPHAGSLDADPPELAWVDRADAGGLEQALTAAHAARGACAALPRHRRRRALLEIARGLEAQADTFARRITDESGKPLTDARGEVRRAITTFELAAEACGEQIGEWLDLGARESGDGYLALTRRVPVGVCSFITPFNFPLNLVAHKVAPAIAAGCPFVLKPSERTPLSALALAELLAEQELPEGAWSVLPLELEDVGPLTEDDRVALVSFTGSEQVGWDLAARAGGKRVALELGGNAACIVHRGADLDDVVARLLVGGFSNSGQSCISVQRVLAHRSLADALVERLVAAVRALPSGDPTRSDTRVGPLIDAAAAARVETWIHEARTGGGQLACGGGREGRLVEPTVVLEPPADCRLERDELFGPALTVSVYDDFEDALARADRGRFGLQLGLFGVDLDRGLAAADAVAVGGLVLGDVPTFRADAMPYGGRRRSGLGREGPRWAIEEFTEPQVVVVRRRRD